MGHRQHEKQMVIPGKRAVMQAFDAGISASTLFLSDSLREDEVLADLASAAKSAGVRIKRVPQADFKKRFAEIERADQGVVLIADPFAYTPLGDLISNAEEDFKKSGGALIVVCDHITDAGNLGAIIRSADSAGASGVVIPNRRSAQVTSSTYKTSAGAAANMPIACVANIRQTIEELKSAGFWTVGCTEHADDVVWDVDIAGRTALVMGNEQKGISDLVLKTCDDACRLPQLGSVSSLNVAQAATVMMYEWLRQCKAAPSS